MCEMSIGALSLPRSPRPHNDLKKGKRKEEVDGGRILHDRMKMKMKIKLEIKMKEVIVLLRHVLAPGPPPWRLSQGVWE